MLHILRVRLHAEWVALRERFFGRKQEPRFVNPYATDTVLPKRNDVPRFTLPGHPLYKKDVPAVKKEPNWFLLNCGDVMREDFNRLVAFTQEGKRRREEENRKIIEEANRKREYEDFLELYFKERE